MRNREATRYARWAAIAAILIALYAGGVYSRRAFLASRARRYAPAAVAASVAQQSAQFSFSKVDKNRTLFTVRASHVTQYKEQNRAVLEDVWITIYGADGMRSDNIHTRECSYEPDTGAVHCNGEVQIDTESANSASQKITDQSLHVNTSNLTFNRNTGEAQTPAPVQFRFPAGEGRGVGVSYSSIDSVVRIEHAVEFELTASPNTGGLAVTVAGSSLEIHRDQRTAILAGPASVRQGAKELSAGKISIEFDAEYRAQHAVAEDRPRIQDAEEGGQSSFSATRMEATLNPAGWIDHVVADGGVLGSQRTSAGIDHFSSARVEFAMLPAGNLIKEMTATGSVTAESQQAGELHTLKTDALRVAFSADSQPKSSGAPAEKQRIKSAETLAPATIESRTAGDTTTLHADKFVVQLSAAGRLDKLIGHSGVEIQRQIGKDFPQTSSAAEMTATFGPDGEWQTLDETGNVQFHQAAPNVIPSPLIVDTSGKSEFQKTDRRASADHARMVRATDTIALDGSSVISDSISRTTAANVIINQKSGAFRATGGVISTYLSSGQGDTVNFGSGPAHISAQGVFGSINSGYITYRGDARLWQGDSVLDADQIQLSRDDKTLQADTHVVAQILQATGPLARPLGTFPDSPGKSSVSTVSPSGAVTVWKIQSRRLTYWSDEGKAHLEGGVTASSTQGVLESRTLDVFLKTGAPPVGGERDKAGDGELTRVLALGDVTVRQGDRQGAAEQAEYTAADGKFVLSGGQPTVTDGSSNTATGRSLTFYIANDTILIDSQQGSRTQTRHRVEK